MAPSEPNQNPIQGEFFSADLPKRFIRESVQNSLDARAGGAPVRMRFTISGPQGAVPHERAQRYLKGLRPHFEAVMKAETENVQKDSDSYRELQHRRTLLNGPLPFLVVEDFGTTGLQGDIKDNDVQAPGNDFWGFFRSIGISPKDEDAGGSWGLGKWVFPSASKLNAFLGVTRRHREQRFLLMGQTMLKLHGWGDRKYPPVGFFATGSNELDGHWLPMPVESVGLTSNAGSGGNDATEGFVHEMMRDFRLRPGREVGTSVVIPHPMDELTDPAKLAATVIRQYFHPIIAGDLIVEIASLDGGTLRIDAGTIVDEAYRAGDGPEAETDPEQRAEAVVRVIKLARWGQQQDGDLVQANARRVPQPPVIAPSEVEQLRERYADGKRLAFQVWSNVRRKPNSFRVYVERDDGLTCGHDYYVRGHLHIPNMDFLKKHHARALIVVDNTSELGHLLRDAEGPAHEIWRADAPRLKEKGWPAAAERVREVQRAAGRILDALVEKPKEVQRDALADLFPGEGGRKRGPGPSPPPPPPRQKEEAPVRIDRVLGGFRLRPTAKDPSGKKFSVRMAYEVARGTTKTAFSRFESGLRAGCPDFSLRNGRMSIESKGCRPEVRTENEIQVMVEESDFSCVVTGFDDRDLVVNVQQLSADDTVTTSMEGREP